MKFVSVFIVQRETACFWLGLRPYRRSDSLGTMHSMLLSAYNGQTAVCA